MKLDLHKTILDIDGKPLNLGHGELTISSEIAKALTAPAASQGKDPAGRYKLYKMAKSVMKGELPDDIEPIINACAVTLHTAVYGFICEELGWEPKDNQADAEA